MATPLTSAHNQSSLSPLRKRLDQWLDCRIGNVLFLGAQLPEVAADLVSRGIPVMVVEPDAARLERFMGECRRLGIDKRVSMDLRPWPSINFEMSSYNAIVAWEGLPPGMPVLDFFKKARRELKAGCKLYLRVTVRPPEPKALALARQQPLAARVLQQPLTARLLEKARELALRSPLKALLGLPTFEELKAVGGKQLKFERLEWGSPVEPLLARLEGSPVAPLLAPVMGLGQRFDSQLRREALSPEVLIEASKTLDLGKVFLTGSRFDPSVSL